MNGLKDNIEKLNKIYEDYSRLCEMLTYEEVVLDKKLFLKFEREKQDISLLATTYEKYLQLSKMHQEFKDLFKLSNEEDRLLIKKELELLDKNIKSVTIEILDYLKKYDAINQEIIVEVVAKNNHELAYIISNGYIEFCNNNNLKCNLIENNTTKKLSISGSNAKDIFKKEIGLHVDSKDTHKVQVFVYESCRTPEVSFDEKDLEIAISRSSGAGGQHINTTDSAIKITHLATGITAICQSERSQFQNKQLALEHLKEKVKDFYRKQEKDFVNNQKKEQISLIRNGYISKIYNLETGVITTADKRQFAIKEFLLGEII